MSGNASGSRDQDQPLLGQPGSHFNLPTPSPGLSLDNEFAYLARQHDDASAEPLRSSESFQQRAPMAQPSEHPSQPTGPRNGLPERGKKLRSQYPLESGAPHVEFILVAAFDIDRGSIMEYQYPTPISGDEHMLAELMLPDQVHSRAQDWTIFFLHKEVPEGDGDSDGGLEMKKTEGSNSEEEPEEDEADLDPLEGPPLVYVLNHVNTKHDSSVKRGAIVKAMALCTRHSFLDIYKPLLVLAIEDYFKAPTVETLANIYNSVNAMDLSLVPRLSLLEGIILSASNAKDMFIEKFEKMIEQQRYEESRGGAVIPVTRQSLPRDTHDFETKIPYNGHTLPVKVPTSKWPETVGNFSIIKLIQTFASTHATAPKPFSVHPHLTTGGVMTHPIIVLVNALLTQKRVVFLGHGRPSEEVAEAVLAACSLASGGVLRGFTRHAFPYTDLTKIDDLQRVPGFIAGVTNPVFESQPEWWDVLCDLPNGRMTISSKIPQPDVTEGIQTFKQQHAQIVNAATTSHSSDHTGDGVFMESVLLNIKNRLGESVIRSMWRDWIIRLTRIAATFEEIVYGASALYIGGEQADSEEHGLAGHGYVWSDEATRQKELAANVHRIEGWRNTRSYFTFKQDLIHLYNSRPIKTIDLNHHHDRLRTQKLSREQSAAVYLGFSAAVQTPTEICQLLTVTSESHGGLFYVSLGLLHPRRDVRQRTVELLERIKSHEAGRILWETLGRFAKLAFFRLKREMEAASGGAVAGGAEEELVKTMSRTGIESRG